MKKRFANNLLVAASFSLTACSTRNEINPNAQVIVYESGGGAFNTKTVFYDNGQEVVAFDAQFVPEEALKAIAHYRAETRRAGRKPNPITHLVVTHPNPDKFNGMDVFSKEGAKVFDSKKTVAALGGVHEYKKAYFVGAGVFTQATYPRPSIDSLKPSFDKNFELRLGSGESIRLIELSQPGVSTNQTVALIPGARAVVVGDLVHHKAHAWLEGGIVGKTASPTLSGWKQDLRELGRLLPKEESWVVYGGRGEAAKAEIALPEQIAYLEKAEALVIEYLKGLGSRRAELSGPKAGHHFAALAKIFEKEFPDYTLAYMIQYGIYGIVYSKLQDL